MKDFESTQTQNYAQATTRNSGNNKQKAATLHKANTGLVFLVMTLVLAAPVFYLGHKAKIDDVPNQTEKMMSTKANTPQPDQSQPPPKPAAPAPKEKPEPPKNVNLRESDEGRSERRQRLNE